MDFSKRVVMETTNATPIPSPSSGVTRIPLERENVESGRTTSVVNYLPGAKFSTHQHPYGEEIFVLEGVFSDESGDYSAGTYLRNPPGSSHAPFSKQGCKLFVKLCQMDPSDSEKVVIQTKDQAWHPGQGKLKVLPLHQFNTQGTALVMWPSGERFLPHRHIGGEEIFVLSGTFKDEYGSYPSGTWIRSPHLSEHHPYVEEETVIFVKTGHLNL
jgi:anti-sigma factor ChrR (cupin superfamily)